MINEINDSNLAFTSLKKVRVKGFSKHPKSALNLLEKFNKNEDVVSFLRDFNANLMLKKRKGTYKLILEVLNPNKEKTKGFFKKLGIPSKLKIKKQISEVGMELYLDPAKRSHYVEIGLVGKDGSRGYYTPNNINDDIIALRKSVNENSPEYKQAQKEECKAEKDLKEQDLSASRINLQKFINLMINN